MSDSSLRDLGWDDRWEAKRLAVAADGEPARVVRHDAVKVLVGTADDFLHATFPKRMKLAVGDWVIVDNETVTALLDRENTLARRQWDGSTQVVGANLDRVFVVLAADQPLRHDKVMRFAAFAGDLGVPPAVVLMKTDLADRPDDLVRILEGWLPDVPVVPASTVTLSGIDEVSALLAHQTVTFVGESGAGKSSLVNALMNDDVAWVYEVRERDAKGRHTTTHRELHLLPDGGIVMDNPGIRALGLMPDSDGVETVFTDIEQIAANCRFRDCTHTTEPGCTVRTAVESGEISAARVQAYARFLAEQDAHERDTLRRGTSEGKRPDPEDESAEY